MIKRLKRESDIDADIVISTIQKLFAVLTGQQLTDGNEDAEDEEAKKNEDKPEDAIQLGNDLKLPPDYFQFIVVEDYQRLKNDENSRLSLNWNLNREIAKLNYRIHTDAIKNHLIPPELTQEQISYKYANEADMLNVVLFGKTAKQWRDENPEKKGNIRDEAELKQLLVLANMESYNAILIGQGKNMSDRIVLLRELAVKQMETLSQIGTEGLGQLHE